MTTLLFRLFIKDWKDTDRTDVRAKYGQLSGVVGIFINLLLFVGKYLVGVLSGSVAICADAVNNLSDAGSSLVSLIAYHISAKPADRQHPFGHARIEYVASMILSFMLLFIGIELLHSSYDKIIHPEGKTAFHIISVIVLVVSILFKLWLFAFNRKVGAAIGSTVAEANAADSLSDVLATSSVLISTIVLRFTGFDADGYIGIVVAIFICISGLKILNDTKNYILGKAPDAEMIHSIQAIVKRHPEALGMHDLMIHNYGPGRYFVSLHVEVDGRADIFYTHEVIDNIEKELQQELGVFATIHMDPLVCDDPIVTEVEQQVTEVIRSINASLSIHDFRMVPGKSHCNLIFDLVIPFELKESENTIIPKIVQSIHEIYPQYNTIISPERQ